MNTPSTIKVSVIIPTYERCDSVKRALGALSKQTFPADQFEVIISIDGSKDGTQEMVNNFNAPFTLRSIWKPNSGRAAARNTGIHIAVGEIVILMDDDMEPSPEFIEAHYSCHTAGTRLCVIGAAPIFCNDHSTPIERYMAKGFNSFLQKYLSDPSYNIQLDDFYGGNMSVRRDLLLEVGAFDESFKRYGYEDTELAYKLIKTGTKLKYDGKALCIHHHNENLRGLANKAINAGKMAILLVNMHPDIFDQLCLREYNSTGRKWRSLRLFLIRLSMLIPITTDAIILIVNFLEKFNARLREKLYALALDYFMWLGIWIAIKSDKKNVELVTKIKSYKKRQTCPIP